MPMQKSDQRTASAMASENGQQQTASSLPGDPHQVELLQPSDHGLDNVVPATKKPEVDLATLFQPWPVRWMAMGSTLDSKRNVLTFRLLLWLNVWTPWNSQQDATAPGSVTFDSFATHFQLLLHADQKPHEHSSRDLQARQVKNCD